MRREAWPVVLLAATLLIGLSIKAYQTDAPFSDAFLAMASILLGWWLGSGGNDRQ